MDAVTRALVAARQLASHSGRPLVREDEKLLLSHSEDISESEMHELRKSGRWQEVYNALYGGFFKCAAEGYAFIPEDSIRATYGRTLKENYPEASPAFLRFATTYWTFKEVALDPALVGSKTFLAAFSAGLEQTIAGAFFPTPGPVRIPVEQRESGQRAILEEWGGGIDIEDFMRGNPILIRDRLAQSKGCLSVIMPFALFLNC